MSFYTDVIIPDDRYHSTDCIGDINLLEPATRASVLSLIGDAEKEGIVLRVIETYRSQARQRVLFNENKTKLYRVGVHAYGLACDMVRLKSNGSADWSEDDYRFLADLARKHKLVWGGDWGNPQLRHDFTDSDHLQRVSVADQERLFSGSWYPDESYDPYNARETGE